MAKDHYYSNPTLGWKWWKSEDTYMNPKQNSFAFCIIGYIENTHVDYVNQLITFVRNFKCEHDAIENILYWKKLTIEDYIGGEDPIDSYSP